MSVFQFKNSIFDECRRSTIEQLERTSSRGVAVPVSYLLTLSPYYSTQFDLTFLSIVRAGRPDPTRVRPTNLLINIVISTNSLISCGYSTTDSVALSARKDYVPRKDIRILTRLLLIFLLLALVMAVRCPRFRPDQRIVFYLPKPKLNK